MTTGAPDPMDLHQEGAERVIGVYLVETEEAGRHACAAGAGTSAASRSATRSSADSIPTESRTRFRGAALVPAPAAHA